MRSCGSIAGQTGGAICVVLDFPACRQAGLFLFTSRQKEKKNFLALVIGWQGATLPTGRQVALPAINTGAL